MLMSPNRLFLSLLLVVLCSQVLSSTSDQSKSKCVRGPVNSTRDFPLCQSFSNYKIKITRKDEPFSDWKSIKLTGSLGSHTWQPGDLVETAIIKGENDRTTTHFSPIEPIKYLGDVKGFQITDFEDQRIIGVTVICGLTNIKTKFGAYNEEGDGLKLTQSYPGKHMPIQCLYLMTEDVVHGVGCLGREEILDVRVCELNSVTKAVICPGMNWDTCQSKLNQLSSSTTTTDFTKPGTNIKTCDNQTIIETAKNYSRYDLFKEPPSTTVATGHATDNTPSQYSGLTTHNSTPTQTTKHTTTTGQQTTNLPKTTSDKHHNDTGDKANGKGDSKEKEGGISTAVLIGVISGVVLLLLFVALVLVILLKLQQTRKKVEQLEATAVSMSVMTSPSRSYSATNSPPMDVLSHHSRTATALDQTLSISNTQTRSTKTAAHLSVKHPRSKSPPKSKNTHEKTKRKKMIQETGTLTETYKPPKKTKTKKHKRSKDEYQEDQDRSRQHSLTHGSCGTPSPKSEEKSQPTLIDMDNGTSTEKKEPKKSPVAIRTQSTEDQDRNTQKSTSKSDNTKNSKSTKI